MLNAGDGVGEHPTQALLDVFTIRDEFLAKQAALAQGQNTAVPTTTRGLLGGKKVALVGDLKHGRTVHSLATLLGRIYGQGGDGGGGVELLLVSPPQLAMPEGVKAELAACKCAFSEHEDLAAVVSQADVVYVTRVQKERFANSDE